MKLKIGSFLLFALPFFALAQTTSAQSFIGNFLTFSNTVLIPFLIGIAFLFFTFNVIRYFVIGGGNDEGREKARNLALYGVLAFFIIVIFWGIVNILSSSLGFDGKHTPTPDYLEKNGTTFQPTTVNTPARTNGTTNATPGSPSQPSAVPPSNNLGCVGNTGFDENGNPCGIY